MKRVDGEIISLCIGQCGNQIGYEFYNSLIKDTTELLKWKTNEKYQKLPDIENLETTCLKAFFRMEESGKTSKKAVPRSILVDMEPKVVQSSMALAAKSSIWQYDENCSYTKQSGSANNWAYGYHTHAPSCSDAVMEIIRKEVERCDFLSGFLITMSLAGGTGSGVGTYLTEQVRDTYPDLFIVNQPVWPFQTGEVIVQNYNSILSMSHLVQVSDALILIENDELALICNRLLNIKKVSFTDMNKVIANSLVSAFLPSNRWETSTSPSPLSASTSWFYEPINHLCAHPGYKLLNIKTIPQIPVEARQFEKFVWKDILKRLHQMLLTDAKIDEQLNWNIQPESSKPGQYQRHVMRSLANMLVLRGDELDKVNTASFCNPSLYANWSLDPLLVCSSVNPFNKYEKSATLVSNSQSIVFPLEKIVQKAWEMFTASAFLHQYNAHHLTKDDFEESFVLMEQLLQNYKSL